jgi:exopolysaccharide biosynthesis polyprenyl glycosylphosphotransferase
MVAATVATQGAEHGPLSTSFEVSQRGARGTRFVKAELAALDALAVVIALALSSFVSFTVHDQWSVVSAGTYLGVAALSAPVWVFGFVRNRLYSVRFITRGVDETRRVVRGVLTGCIGLALAAVALQAEIGRGWFLLVFVATLTTVGGERVVMRHVFDRRRESGRLKRRVVIMGDNEEAHELFSALSTQPRLGYEPVAMLCSPLRGDLVASAGVEAESKRLQQVIDRTIQTIHDAEASSVLIAASSVDLSVSNALIRALSEEGLHVELSSTLLDVAPERLTVRPLGGFPIVYLEPVRRDGWRAFAKRSFDVVVASCLLVFTSPIVALAAVAVKLTSPGPAFFQQVRVGRDEKQFTIFKIRTMVVDAEERLNDLRSSNEVDGPLFKMRNDPRVTPLGRLLRQTSIDELPQLWNVIRGEMSMVGPRPALASEIEDWPASLRSRLRVRPGLTGMWQVSGRSGSGFGDYVRLDLYYVDNWSLVTDLAILARTVPAVIARRGAC